jgi:hypothetical protein
MTIDTAYKNNLANKLAHRISAAVQNGELPGTEITPACNMVLAAIETMATEEDVLAFFDKLSACWPFFNEIIEAQDRQEQTIDRITDQFLARGGGVTTS